MQPPPIETQAFTDAAAAVAQLVEIYERNTAFLRQQFEDWLGGRPPAEKVRATYPFVRIVTRSHALVDSRLAYGFLSHPGAHETTITRPDLFGAYLREQIGLLLANHGGPVEIGESLEPIPVHFAYRRDISLETEALQRDAAAPAEGLLRDLFDVPDLADMDDAIVDGALPASPASAAPLALFRAARTDYSLHRLLHYTGTSPKHFQNFVIFTNYQFYVEAFEQIAHGRIAASAEGGLSFVGPGDTIAAAATGDGTVAVSGSPPPRLPQMPAYHLVAPGNRGITMINIGAGPSNARTMTDHVAVLRPHAWLMLGHCAGLRNSQKLGDYVLAHGYVRDDHVLDAELPPWVPIPPLAEVQVALERAVAEVTGLAGYELKKVMRTGTVASVDNRN
ncbi:MAG: AMP nucleosidase [Sneathiellaceae bacterium]